MSLLAKIILRSDRKKEAIPMFRSAVVINGKTVGPLHPDFAISVKNLADAQASLGDNPSAAKNYRRYLSITEKIWGKNHLRYASGLTALARLIHNFAISRGELKRLQNAEDLYKLAIDIHSRARGSDPIGLAADHQNLADIYRRTHRFSDAVLHLEKAQQIFEKELGAEHDATIKSRKRLQRARSKLSK
jgi:tetratricopeptide (TPR) repeat protein